MTHPLPIETLRSAYPLFVYEKYAWRWESPQTLHCSFDFRVGAHHFRPAYRFRFEECPPKQANDDVVESAVFQLGLAEIPSYWKATCSPKVEVRAGHLTKGDVAYWQKMLTVGMSEFHYVNQTAFTEPDFVSLFSTGKRRASPQPQQRTLSGYLVPIGGGKDSLLSADFLRQRTSTLTSIAINPPKSTYAALRLAEVKEQVVVQRTLDPLLLDLNQQGYRNGHTPFGAVIAFASALAALVVGRRYIVLSNESSANYVDLIYRGEKINHQYAKSTAFEQTTREYLKRTLSEELHYFSLLRPFNELQIAQAFARRTKYLPAFRSCNRGRKADTWCGACPKCVSTFILLSPFVDRTDLVQAVGEDLFQNQESMALLPSLLAGPESDLNRPFECVAPPHELEAALSLTDAKPCSRSTMEVLTKTFDAVDEIPEELRLPLFATLRPRLVPLLERSRLAVFGLGKEGMSTARHLTESLSSVDLTLLDDASTLPSQATQFLSEPRSNSQRVRTSVHREDHADTFDILFRSPGVSPTHSVVRSSPIVASNTSLFFERCAGTIIGVSGTKGKSTTTELIAHVLRASGRDVRVVGNMGVPCLDGFVGSTPDSIFCTELSSFQLEDLQASPHIAVMLGIFPDHLDRHGDMASYIRAKSSLTRYQRASDWVLFNQDCEFASRLAELSPGRSEGFGNEAPRFLSSNPLRGDFNHYNLWPAIQIGRHYSVPDQAIANAIESFRPLPGRLETVAKTAAIRFVCDIRSTAPEVTIAALEAFSGENVRFLFLGGVDRGQDYRKLIPAIVASGVEHLVLFPPTGARIEKCVRDANLAVQLFRPESMEDAIRYVYDHVASEQVESKPCVCLMSTAAPSNGGLFRGPNDKAEQFARWANRLGSEQAGAKSCTP